MLQKYTSILLTINLLGYWAGVSPALGTKNNFDKRYLKQEPMSEI